MDKILYETILVRYGELSTKGKNRKDFIQMLYENVRSALQAFPNLKYEKTYDRLYIRLNGEDGEQVAEELQYVFGISSYSLAAKVESEIDVIANTCLALLKEETNQTFKIVARRKNKLFPMISDDINRYCASLILKNTTLTVDVKNPDIKVLVEVQNDFTYIMGKTYPGAGGYPVGIGGKALLLLSGGIDSPAAAYLTMKRGVKVECIHFASPPYTSSSAEDKVLQLVKELTKYQSQIRVHIVYLTDLQLVLHRELDESYEVTLLRRMMLRIAEKLARRRKCNALVTGESVGQVASQTLESMLAINAVTNYPILRPVVGFDKVEIIELARKIGTYEISIQPFEDCCTIFTPKNPVTKPKVEKVVALEEKIDYETLIEKCMESLKSIIITSEDSNDREIF